MNTDPPPYEQKIRETLRPALQWTENQMLREQNRKLRRSLVITLVAFGIFAAYNLAVALRALGWI